MGRLIFTLFALFSTSLYAAPSDLNDLKALTEAVAPSGFESSVRTIIKKQWAPYIKQMKQDVMGNLLVKAKQPSPRSDVKILFMAHMDEVGFIVSSIDEHGFVHVLPLGGLNDNIVHAQKYAILTEKGVIRGYSGVEAIHIIPQNKRNKLATKEQLMIDIGAKSKQDAIANFNVRPGLAVSPVSQFEQLSVDRYLAKALDDRIGLAAITRLLKSSHSIPNQIYAAATVQEEVGLRGAQTIYNSIKPDLVVNVEIGIANDFPTKFAKVTAPISIGKGPSIFAYDRTMIPNPKLVSWIINLAKRHNIPLQVELEPAYGEDGASVQTKGSGVPVVNIGIPVRYAHQQAGIFDRNDMKNAVALLKLISKNYKPSIIMES